MAGATIAPLAQRVGVEGKGRDVEQGTDKLTARQFAVLYESIRTLQEGGAANTEVRTVLATVKPLLTPWQIDVLANWYRATFQGKQADQVGPGKG